MKSHPTGTQGWIFPTNSQKTEDRRGNHNSKRFNKKELQVENPSGTWNSANVQLQDGFSKEYSKFFGTRQAQHNPQNTELVLKAHDNKKYGTKNTPKPLKSKIFPLGNSGLESSRSQIPSQPQKSGTWCKHLEIHGKSRWGKFIFLSW